jgi:hypothetical protein
MCYFITIAVPARHASAVTDAVSRSLATTLTANRSLRASLPDGYEMFLITSGGCSCVLYAPPEAAEKPARREDHLRGTYAKRGWSQAKIERAVAQSLAHKKQLPAGLPLVGYRADVVEIVSAIVAQTSVVALLTHYYDAGVEDARISVGEPIRIAPEDLSHARPDEDRWLWIKPNSRG